MTEMMVGLIDLAGPQARELLRLARRAGITFRGGELPLDVLVSSCMRSLAEDPDDALERVRLWVPVVAGICDRPLDDEPAPVPRPLPAPLSRTARRPTHVVRRRA